MERTAIARCGGAVVAVGLALGVTGCGGGSDSGGSSSAAHKPAPASAPASVKRGSLTMLMGEMYFKPKTFQAAAGTLRVTEKNVGQLPHEFILVRSNAAADSLPAPGGRVDENKLDTVGEIPDVAPGQSKSKSFTLKAGRYIFICNVTGHYSAGMYGSFRVR